jgi:hypothetical protein
MSNAPLYLFFISGAFFFFFLSFFSFLFFLFFLFSFPNSSSSISSFSFFLSSSIKYIDIGLDNSISDSLIFFNNLSSSSDISFFFFFLSFFFFFSLLFDLFISNCFLFISLSSIILLIVIRFSPSLLILSSIENGLVKGKIFSFSFSF